MVKLMVYIKAIASTFVIYAVSIFITLLLAFIYLLPTLPPLPNSLLSFLGDTVGINENSFWIRILIGLIVAVFYAFFLRKIYRFCLKDSISEATCKNCGVPYQIVTSKQDFVTTSVPRSTVEKRGLDSNGNPLMTHLVSWTEEIGYSIVTAKCNACGNASTSRKEFNRKVNERSDLQY